MRLSKEEVVKQFPAAFNALPMCHRSLYEGCFELELGNLYIRSYNSREEFVWRSYWESWSIVSHWADYE